MTAAYPTKVLAVPAVSPSTYNDEMQTCHPGAMANQDRTRILINSSGSLRLSSILSGEGFDEGNRRIAAFHCIGF